MVEIRINIDRCKGCELCVDTCPSGDIEMSAETNDTGHLYAVIIDNAKCTGCGLCSQMCPDSVIKIDK